MKMNEHPEPRHLRRIREYWQLVSQTAEYRFRICWRGARELMAAKGYDPSLTIQMTCDQGDDVNTSFVLPDGSEVDCDFRYDPQTRQAVSITRWQVTEPPHREAENEIALAAEILQDAELKAAFDQAVQSFFDFHWRRVDHPLPPARV
jgi:hypothetical protein